MKKNKSILIIVVIIIAILSVTAIALYKFLFSGYSGSKYGNRLDGIENVVISDETINSSKSVFSEIEGVENVSYNLSGKICNFIITVNKDTDAETIKNNSSTMLEKFTDEEKKFYDFQIFINSSEESDIYPIIGYKINTVEEFSWTGKVVNNEE